MSSLSVDVLKLPLDSGQAGIEENLLGIAYVAHNWDGYDILGLTNEEIGDIMTVTTPVLRRYMQ